MPTTDEQIAFFPKENDAKKYPSDRELRRHISGCSHSAWHLLLPFWQLSPPSVSQGCWADTELSLPWRRVPARLNVPLKGQRLSDVPLEQSRGQSQHRIPQKIPRLRQLHSTALPSHPSTVVSPEHKPHFSLVLSSRCLWCQPECLLMVWAHPMKQC